MTICSFLSRNKGARAYALALIWYTAKQSIQRLPYEEVYDIGIYDRC